jgi:2-phospho-L-lactate guanylyltransferase
MNWHDIVKQVWALIPLKNFAGAKTRLAGALDTDARRALALAMASDVATAIIRSRAVARVILVSDIPDLDRLIGIDGVSYFNTFSARGLNEDLESAADWASAQGATHILIAHADLPRLTPQAIDRFVLDAGEAAECSVRAAACKEGTGTNLLLAPLPLPLPLVFGKNSLARFRQAAAGAAISIDVVQDSTLEADIDELEDLKTLAASCARGELAGGATAALLLLAMSGKDKAGAVPASVLEKMSPESKLVRGDKSRTARIEDRAHG